MPVGSNDPWEMLGSQRIHRHEAMSKQLVNIHDAFFKQVLSDPGLASKFLREHLPPDVADLLGPDLPEPVPGSFVDEELRQHHSDLLFRIQLKAGHGAFAYVLMEHKSSPDRGARLQLLRYVVRMLTDWYNQNAQQLPLPPVLPLLVHQGPQGWRFSCEFSDLFGTVPEPLRPYLPAFRHALVDLAQTDDRDLSAEMRLRAFLKALKYSRRPDLPDCIDLVLAEAPVLGEKDLFVILTYLDKGPVSINSKAMCEALQRLAPDRKERIMGWLTQPYYDKGKAEGKAEGEANILARLLEKRFGVVPASLRQRIFAAEVSQIESWVERAFDAPDLQSVFESN
jgi:predicted transposase/invertase (TIGR01784 family)